MTFGLLGIGAGEEKAMGQKSEKMLGPLPLSVLGDGRDFLLFAYHAQIDNGGEGITQIRLYDLMLSISIIIASIDKPRIFRIMTLCQKKLNLS